MVSDARSGPSPRLLPAAAALALAFATALAEEPKAPQAPPPASPKPAPGALRPGTLVVRQWLALDAVEARTRVPFNTHVPFARWLLDRDAPPPKAGDAVKGPKGEAAWRAVVAKEDGTVDDAEGAWFHGTVEAPEAPGERVYLAHLVGASTLFVNGAGFVGDPYGYEAGPVPVALRPGVNRLFVTGRRGPWRLRLEPWDETRSPVLREDATLPDFERHGEFGDEIAAVRLLRPTLAWTPEPLLEVIGADGPSDGAPPTEAKPVPTAPLWTGMATVPIASAAMRDRNGRMRRVEFGVQARTPGKEAAALGPPVEFRLDPRRAGQARRITFRSAIDGSAQWYACLPPEERKEPAPWVGTVLSLHGAGADPLRQAQAYSPKPDFRIVAPMNRRPFGFDWQDWGRLDAYEALADANRRFDAAREPVFLTGHSMGGHGVWHLAANDPGRWAAIAPSAGWCSFDTYGTPAPETPLTPIWRAADGGSRTEDRIAGLVPIPTLVLHGAKDSSVPLSEAEAMLDRLRKAGGKPLHHFQEGAEHWWDGEASPGVDCVDWPGIFELFRKARADAPRPAAAEPPEPPCGMKRAFRNRFVLVVGTKGSEAENREMLELARWHATTWWYRAHGCAPLIRDTDLLADPAAYAGRNLVLYGNADVNAAWSTEIPADGPLQVRRGEIRLGERSWKGDALGAVFVRPRPGGGGDLVGAFASTGPRGARLGYGLVPFTSGVGYPDYAVFGEEFLLSGDGGVLAAGRFDGGRGLQAGGFVREKEGR